MRRANTARPALDALVDAMDAADQARNPAPCKRDPELWSSDLLPRRTEIELIDACKRCPVRGECREMRAEADELGLKLNGVIAGELIRHGEPVRRTPSRRPSQPPIPIPDAVKGFTIGKVSLSQALAWLNNGSTHAEIADLAGVNERTVHRALDRLRERVETAA